jgi:hypothetical protein
LTNFGIDVRVDLPGVGEYLQDRYEVGVVYEMKSDFALLADCAFKPLRPGERPDPCFEEWRSGKVTLRSDDHRDVPHINFRYFDDGNDASGDDLEAVVEGVEFVRRMMSRASEVIERELVSGESANTWEQIREFVRNEAWGHHASCGCKTGPKDDEMAVVDTNFRVHGTRNLSGRCVGLSSYRRFLHRHGRVHNQREGERCHQRRRNDGSRTCEADVHSRSAPKYVRFGGKEDEPTPRNRRPAQDFEPAERCRYRGARPVVVGALLPNAAVRAADQLGSCNE